MVFPKTTSSVGDLLEGLTGLCTQLCSRLRLITVKGHKARPAGAKGTPAKVQRKPGAHFHESSPCGATQNMLNLSPPAMSHDSTNYCVPAIYMHVNFSKIKMKKIPNKPKNTIEIEFILKKKELLSSENASNVVMLF